MATFKADRADKPVMQQ